MDTVDPLYNDIRYNSKFVITLICSAQKSGDRVFFIDTSVLGKHTFCVFVRIASPRRFLQIHKTYDL